MKEACCRLLRRAFFRLRAQDFVGVAKASLLLSILLSFFLCPVGDATASALLPELTEEDFARGFILTGTGANEVFDFSPPPQAAICENWLSHGAAED